jgi:predicted tellurium resistance membrane protein TerC
MKWLLIIAAIVMLVLLARLGRHQKQRAAVAGIRRHFPAIARMRLIAACPGLEAVLQDAELRLVFDWILIEMYRRTGTSGLAQLMQWATKKGEAETERLTGEVAREAVDRLPQPVLAVIDDCEGRTVAGVILDEALTEAGHRFAPELRKLA